MNDKEIRVLLFEDNKTDVLLLNESLEQDHFNTFLLTHVETLQEGLTQLEQKNFDVILLDLGLPDSQGLATFEQVNQLVLHIPVVVFSGNLDEQNAINAVRGGAQDYLVKSLNGFEIAGRTIVYAIERHKLTRSLKESENRFSNVFHISPACQIITTFPEGQIIDVNQAYCEMMGYSREELIGRTTREVDFWANPDERTAAFQTFLTEGHLEGREVVFKTRSGELRTVISSVESIELNGVHCIISTASDITERKQAESALLEKMKLQEQFEKTASIVPGLIHIFKRDAAGNFSMPYASPKIREIYGLEPGDVRMSMSPTFSRIDPQDVPHVEASITASADTLGPWHDTYRYDHPQKGMRWMEGFSTPVAEPDGSILWYGIIHDITERKETEEALQQNNVLLNEMGRIALIGAWELDIATMKQTWTDQTYAIHDRERGVYDPNAPEELSRFEPGSKELIEKSFEQAMTQGTPYDLEVEMTTIKGRRKWVRAVCAPVLVEGKVVKLRGSLQDITERKQTEKELRESELRYRNLFENSPIAIWEEDFSQVKEYLEELKATNVKNLETYLSQNEEEIRKCIGLIKVVDVNQAGVKMYEAPDKSQLLAGFPQTFSRDALQSFKKELMVVATGKREFESETNLQTFLGKKLIVNLTWTVAPGHESDYSKVLVSITDITERKQAEMALRASEEKYRGLMESLDSVIATVDAEGCFLYMNDIAAKQLGGVPEKLVGKTMYELFPEPVAEMQMENVLKAIREDKSIVSEYPSAIQGEPRWYRTTIQPIHDETGRVIHALVNSTDIHDLKMAQYELMELAETLEEKVRERTAEVQDLYDNAPAGYHSLDAEGRIMLVNQTELNWLGYTRDEFVGHSIREFMTPETLDTFQANFPNFIERGWVRDLEMNFICKDGSTLATLVNGIAIFDDDGNYLMSRSTVFDNSKRKEAEIALRESQANLQDFLDTASDLIQSLDENGNYIYVNNAWSDSLEYSPKEALELSMFDVVAPEYHEHCRNMLKELLESGRPQQLEIVFHTKSGNAIVVEGSISGRATKSGQTVTNGIFRNITHRKEVENALRIANFEMERALRMKDDFLTSMSHELRTPLTGILGLSEALQYNTYGELNQKQMNAIINIENSGRHLLDLINDILDISKMEAGKLELEMSTCSLGEICQAALHLVRGMANKKNQNISFTMNTTEISVLGDARRLKQIVVNLLSNAVKYSPENGLIGLEVNVDQKSQIVDITVWDKGIGISEEDLKKLFQPFVQLDSSLSRQQTGTGLGLALVHRLVDLHGGSIQVESAPGTGSRFTVSLSIQSPDSVKLTKEVLPPQIQKAMIVEDNSLDSNRLERHLRMLGIESTAQTLGAGVVKKAIQLQPDIILLDLVLPDMSGWDLLKQLKQEEKTRNIPIIVTSVEEDRERAKNLGADGYLVKLFTLSDLRSEIIRVHDALTVTVAPPTVTPPNTTQLGTIMLVDDNETNTFMVMDFLTAQNFHVVTANSGFEFLARVADVQPNLVLMDIQMPDLNGLETIQRLRSLPDLQLASIPVIAITALAMPGDRERCLDAGANEYLSKPVRLRELTETIKKMIYTH